MEKRKQPKEGEKDSTFRIVVSVLVLTMWTLAILASYFSNYEIPNSVEGAFMVVIGYVFGLTLVDQIKRK